MMNRRVDIKKILRNPEQRRKLMVDGIIATQAREGIVTTQEQAEAAYDKVQVERMARILACRYCCPGDDCMICGRMERPL